MPEIFRAFGFTFLFFSHDHEPIHVHVIGKGGDAKYVWNGTEFAFYEQHNIKANDLKKIKMILTIYKMCYIIALKNRKNIKNKQIAQTFEQNRT